MVGVGNDVSSRGLPCACAQFSFSRLRPACRSGEAVFVVLMGRSNGRNRVERDAGPQHCRLHAPSRPLHDLRLGSFSARANIRLRTKKSKGGIDLLPAARPNDTGHFATLADEDQSRPQLDAEGAPKPLAGAVFDLDVANPGMPLDRARDQRLRASADPAPDRPEFQQQRPSRCIDHRSSEILHIKHLIPVGRTLA